MEGRNLALDGPEAHIKLVLGQILKGVVAEDIPRDEFRGVRVHGNTGVVGEFFLFVELLEGH